LQPVRAFSIAENVAKVRLWIIVISEFLSNYNQIDFCDPQLIYVDQFGPSSFLSYAGLGG